MKEINVAFLQKLGWCILTQPGLIWVQLLKAKYFPHTTVLHSSPKPGSSLVWQGISKVITALKNSICYLPRNGATVNLRCDQWIPMAPGFSPEWLPDVSTTCPLQWVQDLADPSTAAWDVPLLESIFFQASVDLILRMPPPHPLQEDSIIWTPDPHGSFSVKGAVLSAQSMRRSSQFFLEERDWSKLWKLQLQDRLKLLLWKVAAEAMPVRVPEFRRHEDNDAPHLQCPCCGQYPETTVHLFHDCTMARLLWNTST